MSPVWTRREFLCRSALGSAAAGTAFLGGLSAAGPKGSRPKPHTLTPIAGKPRERGREYGKRFRDAVRAFLDREIYSAFALPGKRPTRDQMLRYAGACAREVKSYAPLIHDEMEGMAEGTGLRLEELVLITLHEELWHRGVLPGHPHCTAVAAGPPHTADGRAYVGQTWDWMPSVYGLSGMLLWKRPEGPSLLAYAYPGLWVGAALNSAGLAFCWTSASNKDAPGPRVGIPSYVLLAQMMYQDSLKGALAEARRARHAGWFTIVLADGKGNLANVEGSPRELAVETGRGHMARAGYGSRPMTRTPKGKPVAFGGRVGHVYELLAGAKGKLDRPALQRLLADHGKRGQPGTAVCVHGSTLDAMLFDTTRREAHVTRGPACSGRWKTFRFTDA
jgi:isopenicillin-N N-acyltransferase like protein